MSKIIKLLTIIAFIQVSLQTRYYHEKNGLGVTPAMGWNSWNKFGCDINEQLINDTIKELVSTGLKDLGYQYLNLDDCWQFSRDPVTKVVQTDAKFFPSGMKKLGEYIHAAGLKYGLYSSAGTYTCQKRPGSLGFEQIDADTYAEWEVDYLKYDNCFSEGIPEKTRFRNMSHALLNNKLKRPILYSMCEWGVAEPYSWAPSIANSWRTTGDIEDKWSSFLNILDRQVGLSVYAGPGHFNDPDMLEVGNGGMTINEYQAHFALWALLKSPLLIGCDLRNMKKEVFEILSNKEIIAINQDPLGEQGERVWYEEAKDGRREIWAGRLSNGESAVIFFNRRSDFHSFFYPLEQKSRIRDLIRHKDMGVFEDRYNFIFVPPHSVHVFRVTPVKE